MVGIQLPATSTVDRVIDMVPEVMDRIEGYVDKFSAKKSRQPEEAEELEE